MKQALRDYQQQLYDETRQALFKNRSVFLQLATGGGKTATFSAMVQSVHKKNKRAWIIVPRNELVKQSSAHLLKWGVPHGLITAKSKESRAYNIHVVSKDTLIRRYEKIKNWPDLLIIDEAHLFLNRQLEIASYMPEHTKIIGVSATPERLDTRGLSVKGGGLYDLMIEGPSIPELTERGFLTPLRYFSPPLDGLDSLKRRGTEIDEEELEELLKRRKIYGQVVDHYAKYGRGKAALIFCRSVKSAYQTAERFRDRGFNFHCIEGKITDKKRRELIDGLTHGTIDGLTNVDLCTFGLDVPRIEYGASIRPTQSRSLYMQMIGRILRPFKDPVTGYEKTEALFFDHVNLLQTHQDKNYPGMPLHYVPHITWNFDGTEKRKRVKPELSPKACPFLDFMYCPKPHCATCEHNPDKSVQDVRKPLVVIDTDLKEVAKPLKLADRPIEERREIQDSIGSAVLQYSQTKDPSYLEQLLKIAEELGNNPMWVYHRLQPEGRHTVDVPLLHEISRIKNYKKGWAYFKIKQLRQERTG